ncbi:hypothetical protein JKF63_05427 [Porcisia hertigi]|uniref:FHA domain-containing protein n=1 Tax=Porcisia hertigi TaxID=2761500 RepID=A0A836ILF3_9TRYP|nr:hypothetical protein JKF63_05427 [Porcisia hertigi]
MYVLDISTSSPCPSAPYYSLVIRKPYILGRNVGADINLAYGGISAEHVSMTVMHKEEAALEVAAATRAAAVATGDDGESAAHCTPVDHVDGAGAVSAAAGITKSALVVRVTALSTKGDAEIRLGDTVLNPGDSSIVCDGDVLHLGEGICGTFHYRPLMVGIEADAYPENYVNDLRHMFNQLGATVVDEPIPLHEIPFIPIGQLYCAAELNDSPNCLAALSYGYSIVQPTYVFEWFAAVAKNAAAPLSTLPAPSRFELAVRCTTYPTSPTYLRPESDICPFSLFPIPLTAVANRSRANLFTDRVFFFFTDAAATRYWRAVEDCGGAVYGPGDVEAAKEAVQVLVESQRKAGVSTDRLPDNFYIIIDNKLEAALLSLGLRSESPKLLAFIEEACASSGATHLPVMGDHALFAALLSNKFNEEPVPLVATPLSAAGAEYNAAHHDPADVSTGPLHALQADGGEVSAETANARMPRSEYAINGSLPATARSASRASERRATLLPRSRTRTPSRSQMRSLSRHRARCRSAQALEQVMDTPLYPCSGHGSARSTSFGRYGRRRLMPSVFSGQLRSFFDDFDSLRVRIYIFLVREEPKLDTAITVYHKNFFLDNDTIEYALEVKAEAVDFMERVDDLLADAACQGAYTEALRRFWRDCRDMDIKAQHLLHCWDRSMPEAALPRRFRSSGVASISGRRAGSSRSMTPRSVARSARSPAPAAPRGAQHITAPNVNGGVNDNQAAAAFMSAPGRHGRKEKREHRQLNGNPEPMLSLDALSHTQENPLSTQDVVAGMGRAGTGAASAASTPRASSTSPCPSRRRLSTLSPSKSRSRAVSQPLSTRTRPPWVNDWNDTQSGSQLQKPQEHSQQREQQHQPADSLPPASQTPAPTPTANTTVRMRPAAPQPEFATDSPTVVRARLARRSSNTHVRPSSLQEAESATQRKNLAEGTINLEERPKEGKDSLTTPASAPDRAPRTRGTQGDDDKQLRAAPAPIPVTSPSKSLRASASKRASASTRTAHTNSVSRLHQSHNKGPVSPAAVSGNRYNRRPASAVVAVGGSG